MEATTAPSSAYVHRESLARRAWGWLREHAINIYAGLAIAYLLIPIAVIILFSFNNPAGKYNFTWEGFTLTHWENVFSLPDLNSALVKSLEIAAVATIVSTILGTFMAIAHIMFCISFVVVVVRSRLIGFDRSLEEAAQDLGATPIQTFWRVTFPLILPGVLAGGLLAFALSIDDFVVSNFNSGTTVTFPLYIFGAAQRGIPVEVNAIATILFTGTLIAMGITVIQQRRAERLAAVRPPQEEG
jgi:spermidine/putrescine transport system permease protein